MMIKPASSLCNMNCSYCFYHETAQGRAVPSYGIMPQGSIPGILANMFKDLDPGDELNIAFQGGEPTLAGLDWFQYVTGEAEKLRGEVKVNYALQTNGLLIDRAWGDFLAEHRFLTGLSLDLLRGIHDTHRRTSAGVPTWKRVIMTRDILEEAGTEYNILSVLTNGLAAEPDKAWRAILSLGIRYIQFIPCLGPPGPNQSNQSNQQQIWSNQSDRLDQSGQSNQSNQSNHQQIWSNQSDRLDQSSQSNQPNQSNHQQIRSNQSDRLDHSALRPARFARFYTRLFQLWRAHGDPALSIKLFDDTAALFFDGIPGICGAGGRCHLQYVVEADGGVYPCDFFMDDQHRTGNLNANSLREIFNSPGVQAFLHGAPEPPAYCQKCPYFGPCGGGCKRLRGSMYYQDPSPICGYREFLEEFLKITDR